MAVIIKVGAGANKKKVKLELDLRRSMNGDLMITNTQLNSEKCHRPLRRAAYDPDTLEILTRTITYTRSRRILWVK